METINYRNTNSDTNKRHQREMSIYAQGTIEGKLEESEKLIASYKDYKGCQFADKFNIGTLQ